jgi:hypothetical protein
MTRDKIIRMMIEACDVDKVGAWSNGFWTITQEELERFAALVAEAEREACAKVREDYNDDGGAGYARAGIRARSET